MGTKSVSVHFCVLNKEWRFSSKKYERKKKLFFFKNKYSTYSIYFCFFFLKIIVYMTSTMATTTPIYRCKAKAQCSLQGVRKYLLFLCLEIIMEHLVRLHPLSQLYCLVVTAVHIQRSRGCMQSNSLQKSRGWHGF